MDSQRKYDVFLSFRGADTRTGFTGHLYHALQRAGIYTFLDDDEIENGKEIGEACLKAIQDSKFSIAVLSKSFASSSWCLDELVRILKCRTETGQEVWPVFYYVDPSDVEELKGSFGEAFEKMLEERRGKVDMQTVEGWKAALKEVCYLKGLDLQKHEDGHEARNIKNIVDKISSKLDRVTFELPSKLIGVDSHVEDVISLVARGARVVGICGMGGIGKTIIAKKVYNLLKNKFSGSCFLENIREKYPKGIAKLQRQLLSETLQRKYEKIYNVHQGLREIKERLCYKKVLIVLDDIDDDDQVHKILDSVNWLHQESRVIITTRERDLMHHPTIYQQYMIHELNEWEAMQLLCLHAFDKSYPVEGYESCAFEVVQYAGGIPLVLQILGSSLQGESINTWKCRLDKLKVCGNKKIQEILQVSYEPLDDADKDLFLDIACFFVGKQKDYVFNILKGCGFFPLGGIKTLMKKCLLQFDEHRLLMHDLVRQMAREIVRKECSVDPGKRSRIWNNADAIDVLTSKTGTEAVKGLMMDIPESSDSFKTKSFKGMKRLRLLQLNYAHFSGSFKYISTQLCWLCWRQFPLDSIPIDLDLRNLVVLDMRYSRLKIFPADMMAIKKLKVLILSHSRELTMISNFECMPNLETLILKGCSSLAEVHDSIGFLVNLLSLNLKDCKSLQNLPRTIGALRSLKSLNIAGCSNIDNLPEEVGSIKSLVELIADGTSISSLLESIINCENLKNLSLVGCCQTFSSENRGLFASGLPAYLKVLNLSYCRLTDDTIPRDFDGLSFLEELILDGNNFISLPACIGSLPNLIGLSLCGCKNLKSVPVLSSPLDDLESVDLSSPSQWILYANLEGCSGFFNSQASQADSHMIDFILGDGDGTICFVPRPSLYRKSVLTILVDGYDEIPSWFCLQNTGGDRMCFNVPPLDQGSKFVGIITCAVYSGFLETYSAPIIFVTNKTRRLESSFQSYVRVSGPFKTPTIGSQIVWEFANESSDNSSELSDNLDSDELSYDPDSGESLGDSDSDESLGDPDSGEPSGDPDSGEPSGDPDSGEPSGDPDSGELSYDPDSGESLGDPDSGEPSDDPDSGEPSYDPDSGEPSGDPDSGEFSGDPDSGEPSGDPDSGESSGDPDSGEPSDNIMTFCFRHQPGLMVKSGIHFLYQHNNNEVHARVEDLADVFSSSS